MSKTKTILGLDLGSNSIGWALLERDQGKIIGIIDMGARIFPKSVKDEKPTPKNKKRRDARLQRRVLQRRARRKQALKKQLIDMALLPATLQNASQPEKLLNGLGDPYHLRAKALDSALEPYALGRALLHLGQRRGFLSTRKIRIDLEMRDDPDVLAILAEEKTPPTSKQEEEETLFKQAITQLRQQINGHSCRTLGEYLNTLLNQQCRRNRDAQQGLLRTDRQMYQEEFDAICQAQQAHHPVLDETNIARLQDIIFKQRPLKLKANRVGKCSLEPNKTRARLARPEAQRFRYLQDINSLRFIDSKTGEINVLNNDQRQKLIARCEQCSKFLLKDIKAAIGIKNRCKLNFENGTKTFKGNDTVAKICQVYPQWEALSANQQTAIVEDILTITKQTVLKKRLMQHWKLPADTALRLTLLEFEAGHSNHATKTLRKLLPHLEKGRLYHEARVAAGYGYETKADRAGIALLNKLPAPPDTNNPIVNKGLHELRRVVNAVIAEHGKPDVIHIEMARDLEMNTKKYDRYCQQQQANKTSHDEAERAYEELVQKNPQLTLCSKASRKDKLKYRLWMDQQKCCIYSGQPIELTTLFTAEIEIDHILPLSRSLDDSYLNKVVCTAATNRYKGRRTPKETYGGDAQQWHEICHRLKRWQGKSSTLKSKAARFHMTADDLLARDFSQSQLNDTRYFSRLALGYLKPLVGDEQVITTKGKVVHYLRHQWGLNHLLSGSDSDDKNKNRGDHRHHVMDAVVIACIDRYLHKTMTDIAKVVEAQRTGITLNDIPLDVPWLPPFKQQLADKLDQIIISHVPQRGLSGALHEEGGVGFNENLGHPVYRKPLDKDFNLKKVEKIIDETVKALVRAHLNKHENKAREAFSPENIKTLTHKDGKTPIYRVRLKQADKTLPTLQKTSFAVKNKQGKPFKYFTYGNVHHVEILQHRQTGKYHGEFVTMLDAAQRLRGINRIKQPIIKRDHGEDNQFILALHRNELVSLLEQGRRVFYRVQKIGFVDKSITLKPHRDASQNSGVTCSVDRLMKKSLQQHCINAIGKLSEENVADMLAEVVCDD